MRPAGPAHLPAQQHLGGLGADSTEAAPLSPGPAGQPGARDVLLTAGAAVAGAVRVQTEPRTAGRAEGHAGP